MNLVNLDSQLDQILATDLDGTLIPLANNSRNIRDLKTLEQELSAKHVQLVYATGRHLASVEQAIRDYALPAPQWIICDVGASILRRDQQAYTAEAAYQQHLAERVANMPIEELACKLGELPGLRLQEAERQGRFKLSYYADASELQTQTEQLQGRLDDLSAPYSIASSLDPVTNDGLIDLLPRSVSKAYALQWWARHAGRTPDSIVFAGDSSNDMAALTDNFRAIIVGNASRSVARTVYEARRQSGTTDRLFLARQQATSGVLEGCRWFGLVEPEMPGDVPFGATPITNNRTFFQVWAPKRERVAIECQGTSYPLERQVGGVFANLVEGIGPGQTYSYKLDDHLVRPDPRSRFQPNGVHRESQVIHEAAFPWTDDDWQGVTKRDLLIYELHIGSLTKEGTFLAAIDQIPSLVELGITAIEVMPVAQSPGRWNWGYDGVNLYSPRDSFGLPDDFKAFVDACHHAGIAVILDVVYNHLGPEGNYLGDFGPYFSRKHHTPWGSAFNFDGRRSRPVRDYVVENAIYWLDEFHLDGLRLDAVHFMHDDSEDHILAELQRKVADFARTVERPIHLIGESNVFDDELLGSNSESKGYDAIWCDCLMHSIYAHAVPDVKLTRREYRGGADIANALQLGYVYSGKHHQRVEPGNESQRNGRHISSLVMALQTHDSVGNHPHGKRLHMLASKGFQRAAAALFLLYPGIPMIFMGEEMAAESPFTFFADFEDRRLRRAVDKGRAREYPQHIWKGALKPSDPNAFHNTKLQPTSRHCDEMRHWYRDLIALRKRGLTEGWLSPENLTLQYHAQQHLYSLTYPAHDAEIVIHSRLAPVTTASETVDLDSSRNQEVLLSSAALPEMTAGRLVLEANHTVVLRGGL